MLLLFIPGLHSPPHTPSLQNSLDSTPTLSVIHSPPGAAEKVFFGQAMQFVEPATHLSLVAIIVSGMVAVVMMMVLKVIVIVFIAAAVVVV